MSEAGDSPQRVNSGETGAVFVDGKAQGALRTIGEVASAFGIRQHVLRYWEQQFPMLRPLKRSGSRRYYRPADIALIGRIDALINREGYTLKGARHVLESDRAEIQALVAPALVAPSRPDPSSTHPSRKEGEGDMLPRLRAVRARLANALEAA